MLHLKIPATDKHIDMYSVSFATMARTAMAAQPMIKLGSS